MSDTYGVMESRAANRAARIEVNTRQFGRDSGDMYGRHALRNPGGDNVQRDVLHLLYPHRYALHPTRVTDGYVGAHRDAQVDR